jgi:hypothetical protein
MEPTITITSPLPCTIVSSFTLRLAYSTLLTNDDTLAIYIKDNLFREVKLSKEVKISDLPLKNDEIFDIAIAVLRDNVILATCKSSPYKYYRVEKEYSLATDVDRYYLITESKRLPNDCNKVIIPPLGEEVNGEGLKLILPSNPSHKTLLIINASKKVVFLYQSQNNTSPVYSVERSSTKEIKYSNS